MNLKQSSAALLSDATGRHSSPAVWETAHLFPWGGGLRPDPVRVRSSLRTSFAFTGRLQTRTDCSVQGLRVQLCMADTYRCH